MYYKNVTGMARSLSAIYFVFVCVGVGSGVGRGNRHNRPEIVLSKNCLAHFHTTKLKAFADDNLNVTK